MKALLTLLRDLTGLAGAGLISYGTWQIFHPAGLIVGGALLFLMAFLMALGNR